MKKINKKEIFSIPNLLGYFRLLLIPIFSYIYCTAQSDRDYYIASGIVLVSSLTDMFDGKIARKFNMITELGKMLDPIADKLTHAALAFCLATRYPVMWILLALMAVKEGYMAVMGIKYLRIGKKLDGAMWFGKVCTALLFVVLLVLFFLPNLPMHVVTILITISMVVMLFTLVMYVPVFRKMGQESVSADYEKGAKGNTI